MELAGLRWILTLWLLAFGLGAMLLAFRKVLDAFATWIAIVGLLIIGSIGLLPGTSGVWSQTWSELFLVRFALAPHSAALHSLGVFLGIGYLVVQRAEPQASDRCAAMLFSALGISIAWLSDSLWIALAGVGLTLVGTLFSRLSDWSDDAESDGITGSIKERFFGLAIALCGAAIWSSRSSASVWLGGVGIALGLFFQFNPYPFLSGAVRPSVSSGLSRAVLRQIAPAVASLGPLIHSFSELTQAGVFPSFGWVSGIGALLSIFTGLLSPRRSSLFAAWIISGFCLVLTALCFAGPVAAMSLMVAIALGAASLAGAPQIGGSASLFFAVTSGAMILGFPGSSATFGWSSLLESGVENGAIYPLGVVVFLYMLLSWRVVSNEVHASARTGSKDAQATMAVSAIWLLATLSVIWLGRALGAWVDVSADGIWVGLFSSLVGASPRLSTQQTGAWVFLQIFLVSAGIGFALGRNRDRDPWMMLAKKLPRVAGFVSEGYGTARLLSGLTRGLARLSSRLTQGVEDVLWSRWIPRALSQVITVIARIADRSDRATREGLDRLIYRAVDSPGKLLQVIQNGDVRWYLTFALGSILAVLLHFLRNVT